MKITFCAHMYEKKKEVKVRAEVLDSSHFPHTLQLCHQLKLLHPVLTVIIISNLSLPKNLGISDNLSRA